METLNSNPATVTMKFVGHFLNAAEMAAENCACSQATEDACAQDVNWKVYSSDDGINLKDLVQDETFNKSAFSSLC